MAVSSSDTNYFETINSKILLFGEYTILLDEPALAIPFEGFKGHLSFMDGSGNAESQQSNGTIHRFCNYLKQCNISDYFETHILEHDIGKGLYFLSDIPQSYGLGSSGSLCVAIAKYYGKVGIKKLDYQELKNLFSTMESFFHGKSSGTDPLVVYLNSPLLLEKEGVKEIKVPWDDYKTDGFSVFLIDTQVTCNTGPLVKWFSNKIHSPGFNEIIKKEYLPALRKSIQNYLNFNKEHFKDNLSELSTFQLKNFAFMIPKHIIPLWECGLEENKYALKLCGSGGGGFMLGFSFLDKIELSNVFRNNGLKVTYIV